jgi:predicted permease
VIEDLSPDWRVFGFILGAALVTALLFGLVPALQTTRSRLVEANRGDFSSDYRPARLRNILVVTQVAVCALLLISTAIVLRSEGRAAGQAPGLDPHGVWDVRVVAPHQKRAAERLAAEPGVEAVAAAWRAPLYGVSRGLQIIPSGAKQSVAVRFNLVSGDYFALMRIPVLRGRPFTVAESDSEAPVAIVGESAARQFWPGQDAVGQTIAIVLPRDRPDPYWNRIPQFTSARVIGVVGDVMNAIQANGGPEASVYFPTHAGIFGNSSVLVRMAGSNGRARIEAALDRIAPSLADFINPLDDVLALQTYPFRVTSWIAGFLAGVALLLTVSGIYGVMSYLVSQRTKEIGIRVALGADSWSVVRLVIRQSAWLAGIGAAVGAGLALAVAPVFAHQLEVLKPYDWAPYAATGLVVLLAATAASYAPARRAVGIDPVRTLRCD